LKPRRRRRRLEINIVPLVDVLIVLIFFFLVTMQFRNRSVLNIRPPKIETAGENRVSQQIEIGVSSESIFFYNGREVTGDQVRELLTAAGDLLGDGDEVLVLVLADAEARLKDVTLVMDAARQAGLNDLRLQSE
jgi:biopolymer transport protein ExbD